MHVDRIGLENEFSWVNRFLFFFSFIYEEREFGKKFFHDKTSKGKKKCISKLLQCRLFNLFIY